MIDLDEAIASGKWLLFTNGDFRFKLKPLSFAKLDMSQVDPPEEVGDGVESVHEGGVYWLMNVEVISLCKKKIRSDQLTEDIALVDADGFEFEVETDAHLWCYSKFSKTSGLAKLYGTELLPKMKVVAAVTFLLPEENEGSYSLTNANGTIKFE